MHTFMSFLISVIFLTVMSVSCGTAVYNLADYGLKPDTGVNSSPLVSEALHKIAAESGGKAVFITLPHGRYDFYPEGSAVREYYISNHDQTNPKNVGIPFENMKNMVFDGQGSELIFHGRMLPVSLVDTENCTLKNLSIDFENPHITQIKILENNAEDGTITYEIAPWVEYSIDDSCLVVKGEGWELVPETGIAFEEKTRHLVFDTGDLQVGTKGVKEIAPRTVLAPWDNMKLVPGTVIALRPWTRPAPGIFVYHGTNTVVENVKVHYAEGMGLLAQVSENITLDGFSVCLRGDDDPRYFTTQADATHFSGCKGLISSTGGLYEGMMDDAINVHGTYLKVQERIDDRTLAGEYMHYQSYGFEWGRPGDTVRFINSLTMEMLDGVNVISSICPSGKTDINGAKRFVITFENPVDPSVGSGPASYGIENLEWTPEVYFADNLIRNNRARGALFSTPRKTVVENNVFDHTSGTAILLCGDCNGWFETGACSDVVIRGNKFINALTSMYQFTNAVISIYPEIPRLDLQKKYFHSGIVIENNEFDMFDRPLLYAKSVDGLVFRGNTVRRNAGYPPFHWNTRMFFFQRVKNVSIEGNDIEGGFEPERDVLSE
ncbi:MAG: right-handed parallel beta-helix repeat-containing protein [Bacteroidetes bacterium]|uniref:Right-handed parallel beta-helix repeat-containing protein n=1 Tax=Candidatus Cryptobacteroides excrementipullorum TaxID=2840761 RepID=A0A9D9IRV2_9BACT|nr:right-handed parallel beta-helix repeat-containing protein [Candidatus Cryptobacteroides excrementipullorum]